MSVRRAVYAASLDPITNGHINIIERVAPLYDELVVVVAVANGKTYTFSAEERAEMARLAVSHLTNVRVKVCTGRYVVKLARDIGAQAIIRGIRTASDLEFEQALAEENHRICPTVETVWIPCRPELMFVSSSLVKSHIGADPLWIKEVERSTPRAVAAKLREKLVLQRAREHWADLMSMLGNPKGSDGVFVRLLSQYSEPHRAYHDLEHIMNMLDELETVRVLANDFISLSLAIWFHDAVYDTHGKNNEVRSADMAVEEMLCMDGIVKVNENIPKLILDTRHAEAPQTPDGRLISDLDLAILGKSQEEFDEYEANIRKEYSWVSEDVFARERTKILQGFLDRSRIYQTDTFHERYGKQARRNLLRSIEKLCSDKPV
ncbi:MAG: N-methyl-D-aspartate receptor subunit [Parcubacteria group bacterium]|nr:N-methyl-D-aspartate receptor subunit [Parcubacteria group bacterium]